MQAAWRAQEGRVDAERYEETRTFLAIQEKEARWWRDASVLYFQTFSKRPITDACGSPAESLEYFMAIDRRYVPGN
jgi:alpha-glucuronidase